MSPLLEKNMDLSRIMSTDMETSERRTSPPSAASSIHTGSFSNSSSPALSQTPPAKCSPAISSTSSSPLNTYGSNPVLGLYTSEFGGLGGLGVPTVLAAHSQFGNVSEQWRSCDAHSRGTAAIFSPLLGGMPVWCNNGASSQSHKPVLNGIINGRHAPTGKAAVSTSLQSFATKEEEDTHSQKEALEAVSMSGSQSGSLSENSSDGEDSSSDPEDMEEEDSGDENDLSDESDASDSDKDNTFKKELPRLTHNTSDTQKKRPYTSNGSTARDRETTVDQQNPHSVPSTSSHHLQTSTHPLGPRLSTPSVEQHFSVIHTARPTVSAKLIGQGCWSSLKSSASPCVSPVKPLYCSLSKSPSHSILPKSPTQKPSHNPRQTHDVKSRGKPDNSTLREPLSTMNASSVRSTTQEWYINLKNSTAQSLLLKTSSYVSSLNRHLLSSPNKNQTPFLNSHKNGLIQDAPLALVTKPRDDSSSPSTPQFPVPVNLSTCSREPQSISLHKVKNSASSSSFYSARIVNSNVNGEGNAEKCLIKDLDDSLEDGSDTEDSESSQSDSESSFEVNTGSEDDIKEGSETNSNGYWTTQKSAKAFSKSSPSPSANCSLLNMDVLDSPCPPLDSLGSATAMGSLEALRNYNNTKSFATVPLPVQRKRVTDEKALGVPLAFGWQRVTRVKTVAGRLQGEVCYYAPCGKKLRQYPDVMKYLLRNGINEISRDNFSFSTKIKLGDFYEARDGPEGLQWLLLDEEKIAPCIIAMDGRRQRKAPGQQTLNATDAKAPPHFQDVTDTKLLRKLEAQEIARQATQMKIMRKLEKQAMAQAAKEAKKQQAMLAAEERRKKKEQMKILKQQEKIRRIQQNRLEKEVRAQQILEAKRRKKEEATNAKILEAEKRSKEKEMRRLHAVLLKHQEMQRHRLDIVWEREKRRQQLMLMKEVEARKKAEEKERLRKERKDEKRLNKERKLELRRLELEKAKELKKPREDLCLTDHKPLPELSRIPGLVLCGRTFSDCLMVLQFVHSFGKVLSLNALSLSELQEGLLNVSGSGDKVQELLVAMVSAAVSESSLPQGHKNKTALGELLSNVKINCDNVSEVLRIYMESHCDPDSYLVLLVVSLRTKDFRAHRPSEKASILAYLVNMLCCCKAVVSEIDKNIDHMTNLRKEKWIVEGVLRKLRSIHAKKTGKKVAEGTQTCDNPAARNKSKRKEGDSEEEDDDDEESGDDEEEEGDDDEEKKAKKTFEEEDDSIHSASVEELEKQMEKATKQQTELRQKLLESSHSLRSMMIGQDRYKRRYWLLPQCGGVFVEGMRNGYEDVPREKKQSTGHVTWVKEEQLPNTREAQSTVKCQQDEDSVSLYHKPGSLSQLSKLLDEAKIAQEPTINIHYNYIKPSVGLSCDFCPTSHPREPHNTNPDMSQPGWTDLLSPKLKSGSRTSASVSMHQDRNVSINQWFSLLSSSSCDEPFVTTSSVPTLSSSQTFSAHTRSSASSPITVGDFQQQQVQSGTHQGRETLCDMSSELTSPSLPFPGISLPPMGDLASQHAPGNGNSVPFQASYNSVTKTEPPKPPSDKPNRASSPAEEVAKTQDHFSPQSVPEDMLNGWWWMSNVEELQNLSKALHCRGIRERILTKQIQKHMEYMTRLCVHNNAAVIDVAGLQKLALSKEMVDRWCVQEQAMKLDNSVLKQVEALERRVISVNMQVKGWTPPEPHSQREDLVYHEHKSSSSTAQQHNKLTVERRPNNPLDIAVSRLAELERNIEWRSEEEESPWRRLWHKALSEVCSPAQLSLCIQQLQKSIPWDRAIMKVECQICHKGDNEELLLLCDGCDKGCHVYCHEPKITCIPEGDWFCPVCLTKTAAGFVIQESVQSPRTRKQQSQTSGGGKKASEVKPNSKPSVSGELIKEEAASRSSSAPKKSIKEVKKRKADNGICSSEAKHDNHVSKKAKMSRDGCTDELAMCLLLLDELEAHQDAWPFLKPVDLKSVPGYRKVIKKPMDFSTIREKFTNKQYLDLESFIVDVNLVFDNCGKFNKDNSEIGKAGQSMRRFFDRRWTELLN